MATRKKSKAAPYGVRKDGAPRGKPGPSAGSTKAKAGAKAKAAKRRGSARVGSELTSYTSGVITGLALAIAKVKSAAGDIAVGVDPVAVISSLHADLRVSLKSMAEANASEEKTRIE